MATLSKEERICSRKLIEQLFGGGNSRSMSSFPLRAVFLTTERQSSAPVAQMVISVPKRHFKHAVDRNRVKRQIREAYRQEKHLLETASKRNEQKGLLLAFIWMAGEHKETQEVVHRMHQLLTRITEQAYGND
ncbi:MAG: ribonuclease P protein component [Prevotella sp.]|nr:ribonuclease P protein component [Prevotella sp.]